MRIAQNFRKTTQRVQAWFIAETKRWRFFVSTKSCCEKFFAFCTKRGISFWKKVFILSLLTLYSSVFTAVYAIHISTDDSAALSVRLTPNVDRGIEIDTAGVSLNLGLLDLPASTQTVTPATVTILGNVTNTELDFSAQLTGGWLFDDNPSTQETDNLAVWALFRSTDVLSIPTASDFEISNSTLTPGTPSATFPSTRVGGTEGNGNRFESAVSGSDMDSMLPGTRRQLWFRLRTPPITSVTAEQQIQFTFTVTNGP